MPQRTLVAPLDLTETLKGHEPGEWVVLDGARKTVIAASDDPAKALEAARSSPDYDASSLLMQVPDPNSVAIY